MNSKIQILNTDWSDYELIDSGNRKRLERFGKYVIIRGEPKAWWEPTLSEKEWDKAVAVTDDSGRWKFNTRVDKKWYLKLDNLKFEAKFTDMSKHVGVFPEQHPHWKWIMKKGAEKKNLKLLNLFGYTGIASICAASAGYKVTHVDASKPAIAWAKQNQMQSNLDERAVRWLLDDAFKFVQREVRRGNSYDAVILDPPSFGRGPKGEMWKAEFKLGELLSEIRKILTPKPQFVLLNMYSIDASSLMLENMLNDMMKNSKGVTTPGELVLNHSSSNKTLPMSIFAKWESNV